MRTRAFSPGELVAIIPLTVFVSSNAIRIVTRHRFGKRYILPLGLSLGLTTLLIFLFQKISLRFWPPLASPLLSLVPWFLFVLLVIHQFNAWFRKDREIHTYSPGITWGLSRLPQALSQCLIEPVIIIVVGWLISPFDLTFALFIITAGACLWIDELLRLRKRRIEVLNAVDGRLGGQSHLLAVQDFLKPVKRRTRQSSTAKLCTPNYPAPLNPDCYAGLNPKLKQLMEKEDD